MTAPSGAFREFIRSRAVPLTPLKPSNDNIAKLILAQYNVGPRAGFGIQEKPADDGAPSSLLGHIFDKLSRTNYAVAEFARDWAATGTPSLSALGKGFTAEKRTTYSDFLEELGMEDGKARAALGLGLDIFADPLTYIPIAGAAAKIKTAAKGVPKALPKKPLPERVRISQEEMVRGKVPPAFRPEPKVKPELFERRGRELFKPGEQMSFPTMPLPPVGRAAKPPPSLPDFPIIPKELPGQQVFKFGKGFNVKEIRKQSAAKAENIVEGVTQGAGSAIAKIAPKPLPTPKMGGAKLQAAADDILGKFNPSATKAQLNKVYPDSINARQQVRLWHNARIAVQGKTMKKGRDPAKVQDEITANTVNLVKRIEDGLIAGGKVPRIGSAHAAEDVKLSDVVGEMLARGQNVTDDTLKEFGSTIKKGSPLDSAIQVIRARGAIKDSSSVGEIIGKVNEGRLLVENSKLLSDANIKGFEQFAKGFAKDSAKMANLSPAAIKATGSLMEQAIKAGKSAAQVAIEGNRRILDDIVATGKNNPKVVDSLTIQLEKDLGKLPKLVHNDNKAVEWIMARVATQWGQKELRPMTLNWIGSGYSTAKARGEVLDHMFRNFTPDQGADAFKIAQGLAPTTTASQEVVGLSQQITRFMDNAFGHAMGQSVVFRSGVTMDNLNKWMKRWLPPNQRFMKDKVKHPLTGETVDLSKGADWVEGWKYWDLANTPPQEFLYNLQHALSQATVERAFFDDLAARFGSRTVSKDYKTKVEGFDYLDGWHFPKNIAEQIPRAVRDWTLEGRGPWGPSSDFGKFLDRLQSMWKSSVTIYRPGHHVRNMSGDAYLGWLDGVNSVRPYKLAAQVQRSMRGQYEDIVDVDRLIEVGVMHRSFGTPVPGQVLFRNKSGIGFTAEQIKYVADQKGLLEHTRTLEDIIDLGEKGRKGILGVQPFGGRVQRVARGASELQSHNGRLAHFIDKIQKSKGNNLDEIFEKASRRARKFHPTGLDLTFEEKKYARRIIPFYSWLRKSTPLLLEGLFMKPGKTVIPAKAYGAVQEMAGIETPGRHDPFPVDQLFPDWITDQGLGPVSKEDGLLAKFSNQTIPGYVMGGVGLNPFTDLMASISSPERGLKETGSLLTPGAVIPIEHMMGRKMFTGEPITGPEARPGAYSQYVGENIPYWTYLQDMLGVTPTGTPTKREAKGTRAPREAILQWFTHAGIKGTGQYISSAKFEERQPFLQQRRLGREEFFRGLRESEG